MLPWKSLGFKIFGFGGEEKIFGNHKVTYTGVQRKSGWEENVHEKGSDMDNHWLPLKWV
jgi:hypothetical protein